MNWFMPALVKSSVGSFVGTSEELRTTRWPRSSKKRRKVVADFVTGHYHGNSPWEFDPPDSVPGRVCCEPLFSVTCVTFYSPTVSIRARNARVGRFRTRGGEPKAESCGARLTRSFCCLSPNWARWFTPAILGREATQRKDPRLWTIWRLEAGNWKRKVARFKIAAAISTVRANTCCG